MTVQLRNPYDPPVKVRKIRRGAQLPVLATPGSVGWDLYSCLEAPVVLKPGERALIPTGLAMDLGPYREAQIRPRSGLAWKHGITVLNAPGTIDSDYRGELKVMLVNMDLLRGHSFTVHGNERIAQMTLHPVYFIGGPAASRATAEGGYEGAKTFVEVDHLPGSRRQGGFGSTGNK